MITNLFLSLIFFILNLIFGLFPVITTLPFGIDSVLVYAVTVYQSFAVYLWPLVFPMQMAVVYVLFALGMLGLKLLLGHRTPGVE